MELKFDFVKQIAKYIIYVGSQRKAQDRVAAIYSVLLDVEKYITKEFERLREEERRGREKNKTT